jgi:hypothetical protein
MKEFKTIMIRGLDEPENKTLVDIMNKIINDYPAINTGQAVFEFVLKDWLETKTRLKELIREYNQYQRDTRDQTEQKDAQIEKLKTTISDFQKAFKTLNSIK